MLGCDGSGGKVRVVVVNCGWCSGWSDALSRCGTIEAEPRGSGSCSARALVGLC